MRTQQLLSRMSWSPLLLVLLTALVGACGLPSLSTTTSPSSSATPCPSPMPFQAVNGTIKSINGTMLVITDTTGSIVNVTYSSTTRFSQQTKGDQAALKSGVAVVVMATQGANNTYTATRITLANVGNQGPRPSGTPGGRGGSGRGGQGCNRQGFRGGANGASPTANGTRRLAGTVSQLSGNTLTVTTLQQGSFNITVNSTTQIVQTTQASASALQVGTQVNIVGLRNAQGVITAQSVMIVMSASGT